MSFYAQTGRRPCRECGREFNYRGGHRVCSRCKAKIKKSAFTLEGNRRASAKQAKRHQCGNCLGKNLVQEAGGLCESCIASQIKEELRSTGTNGIGCLGGVLFCAGLFGAFVALGKGEATVGVLVGLAFLCFLGIRAISHAAEKTTEATASVLEEAKDAYGAEIRKIEKLIGYVSHNGKGSKNAGSYFVYLHYFPDSNKVVYVGKGKNSRDQNEKRTNSQHTKLLRTGKLKVHRVLTAVNERVALEQESYLIGLFGRQSDNGELFNVQGGLPTPKNHLPFFVAKESTSSIALRAGSKRSIKECMSLYATWMEEENQSKEGRRKKCQHIQSISKELGWEIIADLSRLEFEACLERRGVSKGTVDKYRSSFSSFCTWLSKKGILSVNPFRGN